MKAKLEFRVTKHGLDEKLLKFSVLEIWKRSTSIKSFKITFGIRDESLMKLVLLIKADPKLVLTIDEIKGLILEEADWAYIADACEGKRPKAYAGQNFKLALKISELLGHVDFDEKMLKICGLTTKDCEKEIVIIAKRRSCETVSKRHCRWFDYCSKVVLKEQFEYFSCEVCPRRQFDEQKTSDVWLLKEASQPWSYTKPIH